MVKQAKKVFFNCHSENSVLSGLKRVFTQKNLDFHA